MQVLRGQGRAQHLDGIWLGKIAGVAGHAHAVTLSQRLRQRFESIESPRSQYQMTAAGGENLGEALADAGRSTGDQGSAVTPVGMVLHDEDQLPQGEQEIILRAPELEFTMRRPLIAGNWKMQGSSSMVRSLIATIEAAGPFADVDVAVMPPYPFLPAALTMARTIVVGAQDASAQAAGAYTGEVSASMLADIGCRQVILGHSERRQYHVESDALIAAKFQAVQAAGLTPILCVGETRAQREAGETEAVVTAQLSAVLAAAGVEAFANAVLAYEPVWAIGTGLTATPAQAQAVHALLRGIIGGTSASIAGSLRILYGGSVKPGNAATLFSEADIDGGLIGGASLIADDFVAIIRAAAR